MITWIGALDRVLKGEVTRLPALGSGRIDVPVRGLSTVIFVLGVLYGAAMGVFAVVARWKTPALAMGFEQLAASAVKVPALFFMTLLATLPSLYVFNALVGSRLSFDTVLRLLVATLGVMLAVLASFATIIVFFSLCTTSYPFMVVLNVVMFAVSGLLGLGFLLQTLHRLSLAQELGAARDMAAPLSTPVQTPAMDGAAASAAQIQKPILPSIPSPQHGALDRFGSEGLGRNVRTVFHLWLMMFALVGAQMGWVLRPFIGNPALPFTLFRPRSSNFFESVFHQLRHLLS